MRQILPRLTITTATAPIIALLSVASAVLAQDSGAKKDATTTDVTTPVVSFDRATGDDAPTGQGPSDFALQLAALYAGEE